MDSNSWEIIKIICGAFSGIFALAAAVFTFINVVQNGKHEKTKAWFKARWVNISNSKWLELVNNLLKWILRIVNPTFLLNFLRKINRFSTIFYAIFYVSIIPIVIISGWIFWGIKGFIISSVLIVILVILFVFFTKAASGQDLSTHVLGSIFLIILLGAVTLISIYLIILITLKVKLITAVLVSSIFITLMPLFAEILEDFRKDFLFILAVFFSFFVTYLSMFIGHLVNPTAWVPKTPQMLISNVLFDGFTLVFTIWILMWAISSKPMFRIPIAIIIDIFVAVVFACCSLFFGLIFTKNSLSVFEILNVLIGKTPDGSQFSLGPFFWTMHTVFIPTSIYLFLILVAWVGKAILIPVRWLFGVGKELKSPLALAVALFTVFAVFFGCLSFAAKAAQDIAEQKKNEEIGLIQMHQAIYESIIKLDKDFLYEKKRTSIFLSNFVTKKNSYKLAC